MYAPVHIPSGHPCFSVSSTPGFQKGGSNSSPTHVCMPAYHVPVPPGQLATGRTLTYPNQAFHPDAHGDYTSPGGQRVYLLPGSMSY